MTHWSWYEHSLCPFGSFWKTTEWEVPEAESSETGRIWGTLVQLVVSPPFTRLGAHPHMPWVPIAECCQFSWEALSSLRPLAQRWWQRLCLLATPPPPGSLWQLHDLLRGRESDTLFFLGIFQALLGLEPGPWHSKQVWWPVLNRTLEQISNSGKLWTGDLFREVI